MPRTAIVTDSTADFAGINPSELNVAVVPLTLRWGPDVLRDKVDLSTSEFYRRLRVDPTLPKTAAPASGLFEETYQELLAAHESVISLHISALLSGTYNAAAAASRPMDTNRVRLVDSQTLSVCLGWLVERAAELAAANEEAGVILEQLNQMIPRLRLFGTLETLEFLYKGGRIGKAQAFLGGLLAVKPILQVADGEVQPVERVRTRGGSVGRLRDLVEALGPKERIAVVYGGCEEEALALRDRLAEEQGRPVPMAEIGSVFGVHAGPGVLGIGCLLAA